MAHCAAPEVYTYSVSDYAITGILREMKRVDKTLLFGASADGYILAFI